MKKISIIIPTWNSGVHIDRCLSQLQSQDEQDFEVILVYNGSRAFIYGLIGASHPNMNIIEIALPENRGFAVASNIGARKASGEWLALLNADAFPEPGWLAAFMDGLRDFSEAGAFGLLILYDSDPGKVDSAGDVYNCTGIAWKSFGEYPLQGVPARDQLIFSPCAAAAFYRRDLFVEIGGFDEDFFSYFEDVDLGFRLNLHGYTTISLFNARVRHTGSASTGRSSDFALYHYHRNMVWSYLKNMPGYLFWLYLPFHILSCIIFYLKYLKNGRGGIIWKAKIDAIKGLPGNLNKRRLIQKKRRAHVNEINRILDKHLILPYRLGHHLRKYYQAYPNQKTDSS